MKSSTDTPNFLGLRTAIYHAPDLAKAKSWYSKILGMSPIRPAVLCWLQRRRLRTRLDRSILVRSSGGVSFTGEYPTDAALKLPIARRN